jgi:hypothetical protein
MTKNQKILLGCGGGGCLGLILLVIVCGVLIAVGVINAPGIYSANSNYNYNSNYNSNNSNANTNSNSDSSSSSMTEDEKHKLYQAAGMTKDNTLMLRAIRKVGLGDGTGSDHQAFIKDHFAWAMKNLTFIQSVNTPETARAYVEAHIDD